jgi:hypothetical protein
MPVGAWEIEFGCTTIADPNRVSQYVANAQSVDYCVNGVNLLAPVAPSWSALNVTCGCDALNWNAPTPGATPEPVAPYTTPADDPAPWYSSLAPESAHFWGFMIEKIEEHKNPPISRSVNDRITAFGGATLGLLRRRGRVMKVTMLAFGAYEAALDYGFRWLADVLTYQNTQCEVCDLTMRSACPILSGSPTYDEWDVGRWTFKQVGIIDGPRYEEPPNPNAECNLRRVSFVVGAMVPHGFKCPVQELDEVTWIEELWNPESPEPCPPTGWMCDPRESVCVSVSSDYVIGDDALVIEINADPDSAINDLLIEVTPDPYGWLCDPASAPAGYVPPPPCDVISIPVLPASYKLRYDSTIQEVTVTMPGGQVIDGTPYLDLGESSPPTFPSIRGGTYCVCISSNRCSWNASTANVSLWTVHRELAI